MKNVTMNHLFYVVNDMNRNMILGRDWLIQNKVRIYFALQCIKVGQVYVPLEEDIHIASIIRLKSKTVIKPQTSNICLTKIKNNPEIIKQKLFQISQIDTGYVSTEPGLMVGNSVVKMNKLRQLPIMIVNNTDKTFTLKRGCIVGKIEAIQEENIASVNNVQKSEDDFKIDKAEINAPEEYKELIENLIIKNINLFANKDSDLGQTDTITMKIDTGDHPPIKQTLIARHCIKDQ